MSDFYVDLRDNVATPVVREFGTAITLKKKGTSATYTKAYDAAKGMYKWTLIAEPHTVVYVDPAAATQDAGSAVVEEFDYKMIDGAMVKAGDLILWAVDIAEPVLGADVITVLGIDREVVRVQPIAPGGVTVLYKVHVR